MPAGAASWDHQPFVGGIPIPYRGRFSTDDFALIRGGLVPEAMEDKWFIFFEDPFLYLHRSWSGDAVYRVTIFSTKAGAEVTEALCAADFVERDGRDYAAKLLDFLVGNLLLGRDKSFPMPGPDPDNAEGLLQHVIAGTGYPQTAPTQRRRWFNWWRKR